MKALWATSSRGYPLDCHQSDGIIVVPATVACEPTAIGHSYGRIFTTDITNAGNWRQESSTGDASALADATARDFERKLTLLPLHVEPSCQRNGIDVERDVLYCRTVEQRNGTDCLRPDLIQWQDVSGSRYRGDGHVTELQIRHGSGPPVRKPSGDCGRTAQARRQSGGSGKLSCPGLATAPSPVSKDKAKRGLSRHSTYVSELDRSVRDKYRKKKAKKESPRLTSAPPSDVNRTAVATKATASARQRQTSLCGINGDRSTQRSPPSNGKRQSPRAIRESPVCAPSQQNGTLKRGKVTKSTQDVTSRNNVVTPARSERLPIIGTTVEEKHNNISKPVPIRATRRRHDNVESFLVRNGLIPKSNSQARPASKDVTAKKKKSFKLKLSRSRCRSMSRGRLTKPASTKAASAKAQSSTAAPAVLNRPRKAKPNQTRPKTSIAPAPTASRQPVTASPYSLLHAIRLLSLCA